MRGRWIVQEAVPLQRTGTHHKVKLYYLKLATPKLLLGHAGRPAIANSQSDYRILVAQIGSAITTRLRFLWLRVCLAFAFWRNSPTLVDMAWGVEQAIPCSCLEASLGCAWVVANAGGLALVKVGVAWIHCWNSCLPWLVTSVARCRWLWATQPNNINLLAQAVSYKHSGIYYGICIPMYQDGHWFHFEKTPNMQFDKASFFPSLRWHLRYPNMCYHRSSPVQPVSSDMC